MDFYWCHFASEILGYESLLTKVSKAVHELMSQNWFRWKYIFCEHHWELWKVRRNDKDVRRC